MTTVSGRVKYGAHVDAASCALRVAPVARMRGESWVTVPDRASEIILDSTGGFTVDVEPGVWRFTEVIGAVIHTEILTVPDQASARYELLSASQVLPDGATWEAVTLNPGEPAQVSVTGAAPNQHIVIGVPQGVQGPQGPQGDQGPQGPQGETGETGAGLSLAGTVATAAELPAGQSTGTAFVAEDTGHLWVMGATEWADAGQVKGDQGPAGETGPQGTQGVQGPQGDPGPANSLSIGTVTTLTAGSSATAEITGHAPAQTLNLALPKGPQGETGPQGDPGPANSLSIGTVTTLTAGSSATAEITGDAPAQTLNLGIPAGQDGSGAVTQQTVAVTAAAFSDNAQDVFVSGLGTAPHVVSPVTRTDADVWAESGMWVSNPSADTLHITCEKLPTADISMTVTIL